MEIDNNSVGIKKMCDKFAIEKCRKKEKVARIKDRKLNVFYESIFRLKSYISSMDNQLDTLVIIGQPEITSLNEISELKRLKELWIVECRLKDITCLSKNLKLEKVYLYANEIQEIPDLSNNNRLKIVSLARNKIIDFRNIGSIPHLEDFNLADNGIETIPNIFSAASELRHINLSGNPLYQFEDVENLYVIKNLKSIEFGDPLYGECPIVSFCNYRPHLINRFPNLREIDYYPISYKEKDDLFNKDASSYNKVTNKKLMNGSLVDSSIFSNMFSSNEFLRIQHLTISDCSIFEADLVDVFLPNLESLDLSKNRISSLRGLRNFQSLRTLCLSYNDLGKYKEYSEKLSSARSESFPNLVTLYASHNKISSISSIHFPEMPRLKYIFLQYNKIIDIDGLQHFPNLDTTILDYNDIENIPENGFCENGNIRALLLENNKLTSLSFAKNLPKIEKLFVANNKIADKKELKNVAVLNDLKELTILGNPLCKFCNHYAEIFRITKNIKSIDGHFITKNNFNDSGCVKRP